MNTSRDVTDQKCWAILCALTAPPGPPPSYAKRGVPSNFKELAQMAANHNDWELAWSAFLHQFFTYKLTSFFETRPPATLPLERQAQLAGATESLCVRFGLPVPQWVEDPHYCLAEPWCPELMLQGLPVEFMAPRCSPAFLKRNVLLADRDLITL